MTNRSRRLRVPWTLLSALLTLGGLATAPGFAADLPQGRAAEHVTLTNGFELVCDHRELNGDRVRLYMEPGSSNFMEVAATEVASVEAVTLPPSVADLKAAHLAPASHTDLTPAELHELLSSAGSQHNLDVNLLASLVRAESGGHTKAVSKAGAQGLMQLMPGTAAQLGVHDSFRPDQNVAGGAAYLDALLTRYHDKLALALAAYNAGPAAVDRYHGVPPYRETRLYVARVIRDFNAAVNKSSHSAPPPSSAVAQVAASGAVAP